MHRESNRGYDHFFFRGGWFVVCVHPILDWSVVEYSKPGSIEWFIEDQTFCSRLLAHPLHPTLPAAVCLSLSVFLCVAGRAYWEGWGEGGGGGKSQVIRQRENMALYKSFNPLCSKLYHHFLTHVRTDQNTFILASLPSTSFSQLIHPWRIQTQDRIMIIWLFPLPSFSQLIYPRRIQTQGHIMIIWLFPLPSFSQLIHPWLLQKQGHIMIFWYLYLRLASAWAGSFRRTLLS